MSRQDRQGVRRPAELEQKYNLGYSLDDLKNATKRLDNQITSQGQAMARFEEATHKTQEALALDVTNLNIDVSIVQKGQQQLKSDVRLLNNEISVIKNTQTEVVDDVSTLEQNVSNLQQSQEELSQDISKLDNELSTHTHSYAGSSSPGGSATSAEKLTTDAGDENTPVYFSGGKPAPCTSLDLDTTGNAATATALQTGRKFRTKLGSTSQASFDGTANCNPGVTGTLGIGNGGTGATTAADALAALGGTSANGHWHEGSALKPAYIEVFPGASAGHGGYIDFHYNNSTADYTSRLIESPSGTLTLNGGKILTAANFTVVYNASVSFTNGIATYSNSAITASSIVFVQRRTGAYNSPLPFGTTRQAAGSVTIATNYDVSSSVTLNILIVNL